MTLANTRRNGTATKRILFPILLLFTICECAAVGTAQDSEATSVDEVRGALIRNDLKIAVQEARQGIQEYPASVPLYELLGGALFKSGANDEARAAFQKAIDLAPLESVNYFNLARVDLAMNRYADVVTSLTTFLKFEPNDPAA